MNISPKMWMKPFAFFILAADFEPPLWSRYQIAGKNVKFTCNVKDSNNPNAENPYESVIELNQVDYNYLGYYYCIKNSSNIHDGLEVLDENGQAAHIYLFVEGKRCTERIEDIFILFIFFKYFFHNLTNVVFIFQIRRIHSFPLRFHCWMETSMRTLWFHANPHPKYGTFNWSKRAMRWITIENRIFCGSKGFYTDCYCRRQVW